MSDHVNVIAVPELRRYAPDLLRVLGVPIGQADEVADTLVWTEAVQGGAVRFIQENRARMYWVPRPRAHVVSQNGAESTVDARGGSLLELGARILDFVTVQAKQHAASVTHVDQCYGAIFAPYLESVAAERSIHLETVTGESRARTGRLSFIASTTEMRRGDLHASWKAAWRRALDRGIEMSDDDFRTVAELFEMLRVPTSDRSRTHAG